MAAERKKPNTAPSTLRDVWTQLAEEQKTGNKKESTNSQQQDSGRNAGVLFVGSSGGGKSTLLQSLLYKHQKETPPPTTNLEYKYTRSSVGLSADKELCHFWELGGGRALEKLLEIAVTSQSVETMCVIVTLDLTKSSSVVEAAQWWLKRIRAHVTLCVNKAEKRDPQIRARMSAKAQRVWSKNPDRDRIQPRLVPVLLVASKYDQFKREDRECLKVMGHTLRAIAHSHGASLYYTGANEPEAQQSFRGAINRHLLGRDGATQPQRDHRQPLCIPAGTDDFASIGAPPSQYGSHASQVEGWCSAFKAVFPPADGDALDPLKLEVPMLEEEAVVDQMLSQKNDEYKRIRNEAKLLRRLQLAGTEKPAQRAKKPRRAADRKTVQAQ